MQQEYHEQPWQSALLIMARMLWALDLQIASLTDVGVGAGVNWSFNLNTDYMGWLILLCLYAKVPGNANKLGILAERSETRGIPSKGKLEGRQISTVSFSVKILMQTHCFLHILKQLPKRTHESPLPPTLWTNTLYVWASESCPLIHTCTASMGLFLMQLNFLWEKKSQCFVLKLLLENWIPLRCWQWHIPTSLRLDGRKLFSSSLLWDKAADPPIAGVNP